MLAEMVFSTRIIFIVNNRYTLKIIHNVTDGIFSCESTSKIISPNKSDLFNFVIINKLMTAIRKHSSL
jgi:hypothetical protein